MLQKCFKTTFKMTKLFVSENDHEKAALSLAFLKITTILFRFRPKKKEIIHH